jgi:hypothetical protein
LRSPLHESGKPSVSAADGAHAPDSDAAWPEQAHARRVSLGPVTALLSVALVAVLGIWGGAELQKRQSKSSTSAAASALPTGFPGRFGGGSGGIGAAGTGTAATGVTVGTVTVISGKTLYLTSSNGAIVKAKLTGTTTYTRNATTTKTGLKPGDTAIVQGAKNAAGVVVATSVSSTAKGVTSTTGGFPGGIGTGGGAPTGAGAPGG